jgi:hypothetical protein
VSTLTDVQKEAVLLRLVQEAIRLNGARGVIALSDPAGGALGYLVPQAAAVEHLHAPPQLTPEREAAIRAAIATPNDTFDMDEFLDTFSRTPPG